MNHGRIMRPLELRLNGSDSSSGGGGGGGAAEAGRVKDAASLRSVSIAEHPRQSSRSRSHSHIDDHDHDRDGHNRCEQR